MVISGCLNVELWGKTKWWLMWSTQLLVTLFKWKNSVLKTAKITEHVCTPAQSHLLREDWQLSVRVLTNVFRMFFLLEEVATNWHLYLSPGLMGSSGTYWQGGGRGKYPNMRKCTTLLITLFCILGKVGHLSHWLWIMPIILLRRIIISGLMSVVLEEMLHALSNMPQFCSDMKVHTLGKSFSPNWSESEYYSVVLYYILYDRLHSAGWMQ